MDKNRKHIVFLNSELGYGGAEKNMAFVANYLAKNTDMRITFLTYRDSLKEKDLQHLHSTIERVRLSCEKRGSHPIIVIKSAKIIRKYLKENKVDMVVSFLSPSFIRSILACIGLKTKVLLSERSDPYLKGKNVKERILKRITHIFFSMADAFVFQTDKAKLYYGRRVQRKATIIPNYINNFSRTCSRDFVEKKIVFVARAEIKQKRQDIIIDAFNMLSKEYPEYILELYGDGEDLNIISERASVNDNIKVCGATTNVVKAIQNATMFVLTSDYEGIPNALLEAMSLGIPCISTDCSPGGAAMLIENYQNGIIVEKGNVHQVYEAMKYMIEHPNEAENMGQNAMYVNRDFNEDVIGKKWIDVISQNIKVIFIIPNLGAGGAERVVITLSQEFIKLGMNVDIVLLIDSTVKYPVSEKVRVIKLNTGGMGKISRILCLRKYLKKEKSRNKNIIAIPFLQTCLKNTLAARFLLRIPVIASERNDPHRSSKLSNVLYMLADSCVFQTNDAKAYFNYLIQKKSHVIANPLFNENIKEWMGEESKCIISVGRLERQKNQRLLIDAFEKVIERHPQYYLTIYGEGTLEGELKKQINEKNLEKRVFLMGNTTEILDKLSEAYMFVLSSDYEGMSNAMIEALATGLPVVSTDHPIGGARELIRNKENGILIPANNKDKMVDAICELIENPELAIMLGNNGKKVKDKLNSTNIAIEWSNIIYDSFSENKS